MDQLETIWPTLERMFDAARRDLSARVSGVRLDAAHDSNASFPFRAYASLGVDDQVEVVVISVDALTDGNRIRLTADIARADGYILAEMPERVLQAGEVNGAAIDAWAREIAALVRGNMNAIETALLARSAGE